MAEDQVTLSDGTTFALTPVSRLKRSGSLSDLGSSMRHMGLGDDETFGSTQTGDPRHVQSSPVLHYSFHNSTYHKDFNQEFTLLDNRTSVNHTIEDVVPQKKVVFVGNLPINRTEDFIRHELEILFNKHEPCSMNFHLGGPKPYAFIEFVSAIAALKAQKEGYGLLVAGRPIRTELATARSAGFFQRLDGHVMSKLELQHVFQNLKLMRFWKPSPTEQAIYNLCDGYFVDFGSHEEFKQAIKKFSHSTIYNFDSLLNSSPSRKRGHDTNSTNSGRTKTRKTGQSRLNLRSNCVAYLIVRDLKTIRDSVHLLEQACGSRVYYRQTTSPYYRQLFFSSPLDLEAVVANYPHIVTLTMDSPEPKQCEDPGAQSAELKVSDGDFPHSESTGEYDGLMHVLNSEACQPKIMRQDGLTSSEHRGSQTSDGDADTTRAGFMAHQFLSNIFVGSGVTIMEYGTENHISGRLLGHFCCIERGDPSPNSFSVEDLVYIEDFFGARHMGRLLGPVWAEPARFTFFNIDGMPREDPGCPYHGHNCVMGQYFSGIHQYR